MKEQKRSTIIDVVSYASEISVNGVTCVFLVDFKLKKHFKVCKLA